MWIIPLEVSFRTRRKTSTPHVRRWNEGVRSRRCLATLRRLPQSSTLAMAALSVGRILRPLTEMHVIRGHVGALGTGETPLSCGLGEMATIAVCRTQACISCLAARRCPEPSAPLIWSVNSTPRVSSLRQITRHDRRSPKGVRNLNSSGIVYALTPASFAPPFERSIRVQGRSRCRSAS